MSVIARYDQAVAEGRIGEDGEQRAAAAALDRLAQEITSFKPGFFRKKAPPRGLYIWGDVGRGKSMLMDLFFAEIAVESKRRVHFNVFMAGAHALLHKLRREADVTDPLPLVADQMQEKLLCFDEFQVEDVADAMILGRLFEQLFARGTVVVATSNTPPENLYRGGLNRQLFLPFIAQIQKQMMVFHLGGIDHRRDFSGGRFVVGPQAAGAMDRIWRALGGEYEVMRSLPLLGRHLSVPRTVAGAARFSFAELCEAALGPADYLALAENFSTILLDAIPVITDRNAARRFMTLIDTLYDNHIEFYAAAAAEPDALYPEGGEAFQRTVSRLLEMRSDAYMERAAPTAPV